MNRAFPYYVDVQRSGNLAPISHTFSSALAAHEFIQKLVKKHFIGAIVPYVWNTETDVWEVDEKMMKTIGGTPDTEFERATLFTHAATLFKSLSKVKGPLTDEQRENVSSFIDNIMSLIAIETETASDEEEEVNRQAREYAQAQERAYQTTGTYQA